MFDEESMLLTKMIRYYDYIIDILNTGSSPSSNANTATAADQVLKEITKYDGQPSSLNIENNEN